MDGIDEKIIDSVEAGLTKKFRLSESGIGEKIIASMQIGLMKKHTAPITIKIYWGELKMKTNFFLVSYPSAGYNNFLDGISQLSHTL